MRNTEKKFYTQNSHNWLPAVKFTETRRKLRLVPTNGNLYHYGANNPVKYTDPTGRAAWDNNNEWSADYINAYSEYVNDKIDEYKNNNKKFTCEDLALSLLIDFAFANKLPLTIKNGSGTYSSSSDKFSSVTDFKNKVLSTTGAEDLKQNTIQISLSEMQAGDLICMDTGTPGGVKDGEFSHIQVVSIVLDVFLGIRQGNIIRGSSKYDSVFYGGELITNRAYDTKRDLFINPYKTQIVQNASDSFGMYFRRWNFYGM